MFLRYRTLALKSSDIQILNLLSLFGHLVGYLFFPITSSRVHRLCSFFNMMRISSRTICGTKGVIFNSPFKRNWPVNLSSVLAQEAVLNCVQNCARGTVFSGFAYICQKLVSPNSPKIGERIMCLKISPKLLYQIGPALSCFVDSKYSCFAVFSWVLKLA